MIKTRLIRLFSHTTKYIGYIVFWQWIGLLSQIVIVFTIANGIEQVSVQQFGQKELIYSLLLLALCIGIRLGCEWLATKFSYRASVDVKQVLRDRIYEKMLRLGAAYQEQVCSSEVVQVSTEGVEQLETYFGKYLPQLCYSLLAPVTLFAVLVPISWKASVILLICVPLIPLSIVIVQKIAKRLLQAYWSVYTGLGDSFLENLQGLTTLKIYEADEEKANEMDQEAQRFRKITMKVLTMQLNSTSVMDVIAYGGAAVGMFVAVSEYAHGKLGFAGAICMILLASEFFLPLRLLGSYFHIAMNGMAASDKMFQILDLQEQEAGHKPFPAGCPHVSMQEVRFTYDKEREILKGITLALPAGSFVSLVGVSGCGKSTIASLLAGKQKGYAGTITVNGVSLSEIEERELLEHVVLVRHNSYLFQGTVEETLRMAKRDATEEEMWKVLEQVNLKDFLQTQEGLQTKLLEKASNLSGGQCQRLVIARALLKNAEIYIFDEATSNIDVESEELIMQVIHTLAKVKTVLLISHRLANVVQSDCIYFLQNGMIQESGTHEELMQQNGFYRKLFESQMALETYGEEVASV